MFTVSIRAPPKGRDMNDALVRMIQVEFQSARPRRGATLPRLTALRMLISFNPRAPEGARLDDDARAFGIPPVSIRAPPKGRDETRPKGDNSASSFNPRAPEGARRKYQTLSVAARLFQSARPRRGATAA